MLQGCSSIAVQTLLISASLMLEQARALSPLYLQEALDDSSVLSLPLRNPRRAQLAVTVLVISILIKLILIAGLSRRPICRCYSRPPVRILHVIPPRSAPLFPVCLYYCILSNKAQKYTLKVINPCRATTFFLKHLEAKQKEKWLSKFRAELGIIHRVKNKGERE